jgi:hypothetical protein
MGLVEGQLTKGVQGFQKIYTPELIAEIVDAMMEYTERSSIPILAEFAYQRKIPVNTFSEIPELNEAKQMLFLKKQAQLEKGTLLGQLNPSMAIFSLKQLGWSDKQEIVEKTTDSDQSLLAALTKSKEIKD